MCLTEQTNISGVTWLVGYSVSYESICHIPVADAPFFLSTVSVESVTRIVASLHHIT